MTFKLFTCQTGNQKCSLLSKLITLSSLQTKPQFTLFASPRLFPLTPGRCQARSGEILHQPSPTFWNQPEVGLSSHPPAQHAGWPQQASAQERVFIGRKPGHTQVAIFPELSLNHLYLVSCQIEKGGFCLFPLFPCCHQLGPGPRSFCALFLTGHSTSFLSAGFFPNHPSSVLSRREAQLGSFHRLLRNCQCLSCTFWMKCNVPHTDIEDQSTFLILILADFLQSTFSQS